MAAMKKLKKKSGDRKASARVKAAKPSPQSARKPGGAGADESSAALRASAKSFAARLLR